MIRIVKKANKLYKSLDYNSWYDEQPLKTQQQITERLSKIELDGYFGDHKSVSEFIWELKWRNGRRIYYAYLAELSILLLLGGNKNGQNKDITQAKNIFKKYFNSQS